MNALGVKFQGVYTSNVEPINLNHVGKEYERRPDGSIYFADLTTDCTEQFLADGAEMRALLNAERIMPYHEYAVYTHLLAQNAKSERKASDSKSGQQLEFVA